MRGKELWASRGGGTAGERAEVPWPVSWRGFGHSQGGRREFVTWAGIQQGGPVGHIVSQGAARALARILKLQRNVVRALSLPGAIVTVFSQLVPGTREVSVLHRAGAFVIRESKNRKQQGSIKRRDESSCMLNVTCHLDNRFECVLPWGLTRRREETRESLTLR